MHCPPSTALITPSSFVYLATQNGATLAVTLATATAQMSVQGSEWAQKKATNF
ncbi:MAG: hypothetical protein MJZ65_05300 [Paludibacteraceae bacterium]|nr:hypothetical protein [Paludibacteraceae bacterium]